MSRGEWRWRGRTGETEYSHTPLQLTNQESISSPTFICHSGKTITVPTILQPIKLCYSLSFGKHTPRLLAMGELGGESKTVPQGRSLFTYCKVNRTFNPVCVYWLTVFKVLFPYSSILGWVQTSDLEWLLPEAATWKEKSQTIYFDQRSLKCTTLNHD